jgi:hypothetical protein
MRSGVAFVLAMVCGCGPMGQGRRIGPGVDGGGGGADLAQQIWTDPDGGGQPPQSGCGAEFQGCYTVYAHSDHVLYHIDLTNKMLVEVGPFKAPMVSGGEDVITDLAVRDDDTIFGISHTNLYTADATDGHVTLVGPVTACGSAAVALTFMPDGSLFAADYKGAFCKIDLSSMPPKVTQVATIGGGMAIAGDLVAVSDGTMYGTAYSLTNSMTDNDNILVKIDPMTGQIAQTIGPTGYPKLFGVAFDQGQVFGFTHDGSGDVVTIDPKTGKGTLYNSFTDPSTGKGISFAGAGVNAMVPAPPIS